MTGEDEAPRIAQFYCELAERARVHGARGEARDYLQHAFSCQPDCVRAHMLAARLHAEDGDALAAVNAYEAAVAADIAFIPEILPPLLQSYADAGAMERAEAFLERYWVATTVFPRCWRWPESIANVTAKRRPSISSRRNCVSGLRSRA